MGSKFSPSLANLYMVYWEELYIFSDTNPYAGSIVWYGCYIEDFIIIWDGDVASISHFLSHANCYDLNLQFTGNFSSDFVLFLDLTQHYKAVCGHHPV